MQSTKDDSVHRGGGFARIHHGHHQGHHKYTTNHYLMSSIMQDHRVHTIPKLSSLHVNKNDEDANTWMDKLMVVMLVAAGTVCLLTNLLVLCIILKQRVGRITFRYQIIVGQCMAGVISSTVMFYPLKLVSVSLSTTSSGDSSNGHEFNTSKLSCLFVCSAPLVSVALLLMLHTLILNVEQFVKQLSYAKYMVLVSSVKLARCLMGSSWGLSLVVAMLPLATVQWSDNLTKCDLTAIWTRGYWSLLAAVSGASVVILIVAWVAAKCEKRRSRSTKQVGRTRDTMAIIPPRSTHRTLIVRTISPTAIDVSASKANRVNFAVVACLLAPSLIVTWPNGGDSWQPTKNQWVAVHISAVLAGCFSPILHLLCDEMVSSLGLDILKSAETALTTSGPATDVSKRFYTEDDPPDSAM